MIRAPQGAQILNRCLAHDVAKDEDGYNYYGFLSRQGDYFVMREKTDETEYRFATHATKTYTQAFIDRADLDYTYLNLI